MWLIYQTYNKSEFENRKGIVPSDTGQWQSGGIDNTFFA